MIELLKVYAASCANSEQKSWNDFFYSLKKKSLLSFQNDDNLEKNWYTFDTSEVELGNCHIIARDKCSYSGPRTVAQACLSPLKTYFFVSSL